MSSLSSGASSPSTHANSGNKKPLLSCAECRRLKLKCSRVWPCTSCQKRGLANLCPSGALATRPRSKQSQLIPPNVLEHFQQLQGRVHYLEETLARVTGTTPPPQPPLDADSMPYLQKKLLRKTALDRGQAFGHNYQTDVSRLDTTPQADDIDNVTMSLGTLKIGPDGRSIFFGPTAVSEGLSFGENSFEGLPISNRAESLPIDILAVSQYFPFTSVSSATTEFQERLKAHLPPSGRAQVLCTSYFEYASFVIDIVPEDEWFEALFIRLYGVRRLNHRSSTSLPPHEYPIPGQQWHLVSTDELSLFFGILALGALLDLSVEPFNAEAETYYNISKAIMTTENTLTEPTITSIQTFCLASYYEGLQSQQNSSRNCWTFMVLANKTAHIMGLHRDHSMVGLDEEEMQRRRLVFWEVHSMDMIQSLATGRPICTPHVYMDTRMPRDTHDTRKESGEIEESFYRWKYRFSAEVLTLITEHVLRVKLPSYAATLETDNRIRQFTSTYGRSHSKAPSSLSPRAAAQIQMMLGTRETCIMYIHRGFFAHAISTEPSRPESSKYGRSVLRIYEGACIIVQGMHSLISSHAKYAARIWFLWNHLLTACFVLGSIAIRAPACALAATASRQLEIAEYMLKLTAVYGGRPKFLLPIVRSLRSKAHIAQQSGNADSLEGAQEENDELAVIGGTTRILRSKQSPSVSPQTPSTASISSDAAPCHPVFSSQRDVLHTNLPPAGDDLHTSLPPAGDGTLPDTSQQSANALPPDPHQLNNDQPQVISANYGDFYGNYASSNVSHEQEMNHYQYDYERYNQTYGGAGVAESQYTYSQDMMYSQPLPDSSHPQLEQSQTSSGYQIPAENTEVGVEEYSSLWHTMVQELGSGSM